MKETQASSTEIETTPQNLPAPQGIGMAVALDWGLTVQIALTPIISLFRQSNLVNLPGFNPTLGNILFFIITLIIACIPALFGEMVRRGRNWARWTQLVVTALLSLGGLISLPNLYQSIQIGNFWPIVTEIILVIISPLIVWRLSRPATARWFKSVSVTEARRRHGGSWVWFIALWAIVGGVLQTLAAMNR